MLVIESPKRGNDFLKNFPYDYYAGYSQSFVHRLLEHIPLRKNALILDPWNGSGTTTAIASRQGYKNIGIDLNPVMNVVARCRVDDGTGKEAFELWNQVKRTVNKQRPLILNVDDPLSDWFSNDTAMVLRQIANALQKAGAISQNCLISTSTAVDRVTLACFLTIRHLVEPLRTSNPTWLKRPKQKSQRMHLNKAEIFSLCDQKSALVSAINAGKSITNSCVITASSLAIPLKKCSVDVVLTSPPYCTRIDYAISTSSELAFLGFGRAAAFRSLRENLIGTTTVPRGAPSIPKDLGPVCENFLQQLATHQSKASSTYYLKNHAAYFLSIKKSIGEISRVLKPGGIAVFVVQDSWYKDVYNDLPKIFEELAAIDGLKLFQREDFSPHQSMAHLKGSRKKYAITKLPTEAVIAFFKP